MVFISIRYFLIVVSIPNSLQGIVSLRYMATVMSAQMIKLLASNESLKLYEDLYSLVGMPGIIGCNDSTYVLIDKPPGNRSETFRNGRISQYSGSMWSLAAVS